MSYVPRYADGRVQSLAGLGAEQTAGVPPYVTAIIQDIESRYPLNTDSIQKLMDAFSKVLTDEAKKEATERAIVATGLAVADIVLTATGVGAVIAVAVTVVMAVINAALKITQTYYNNESNKIVVDLQNYLRTLAAQYQARLLAFQSQVIEQEAPAAYQLAVSGQALQGLGAWQANLARDMRRAVTMTAIATQPIQHLTHVTLQTNSAVLMKVPIPIVQHAAQSVAAADNKAYSYLQDEQKKVDDFIKAGTGEAQLAKTQEAAAQARGAAEVEFKRQYDIALANSNSPPFRAALRNSLAAIFRTDPTINSLMSQIVNSVQNGTAQQLNMTVKEPSKSLQAIPMVATGAAVAALLFLKK